MNALARSLAMLETRLGLLERRLRDGDDSALSDYCLVAQTLAAVSAHAAPGAGGKLITTKELGTLLGLSPKAILKRRKAGAIGGAVQLGQRGRGALRWDVGAAVSGAGR